MGPKIIYRIIIDLLIIACIFQSWWLAAFALAAVSTWLFPYFLEIILAGVIFDALYGMVPSMGIWGYISTVEAICAFLIVGGLRGYVRRWNDFT